MRRLCYPFCVTRQQTLEAIDGLLVQQPQEKLEALLGWLEQDDDDFEKRLRADVEAGKFGKLIAAVIAEDEAGETLDLDASCDESFSEAI